MTRHNRASRLVSIAARGSLTVVQLLWASPATAVGLCTGLLCLPLGGRLRRVGRTIEIYDGAVGHILRRLPVCPAAMTLGHVVLGQSDAALVVTREHELVHVRQYERWGPLFLPAYGICSLVLYLRGRDAYYENPFEKEAYAADEARRQQSNDGMADAGDSVG